MKGASVTLLSYIYELIVLNISRFLNSCYLNVTPFYQERQNLKKKIPKCIQTEINFTSKFTKASIFIASRIPYTKKTDVFDFCCILSQFLHIFTIMHLWIQEYSKRPIQFGFLWNIKVTLVNRIWINLRRRGPCKDTKIKRPDVSF